MSIVFRPLRLGFASLALDFIEGKEEAAVIAVTIRDFLKTEYGVEIIEPFASICSREQTAEACRDFAAAGVDAVLLFNGVFSTGELTVEIVNRMHVPLCMWGVQELKLADRTVTGSMISLVGNASLAHRMGRPHSFIYGLPEVPETRHQIDVWMSAVRTIAYLKEAKIALIGNRPDGFQMCSFDELSIKETFGTQLTRLSLYTLKNMMKEIADDKLTNDMNFQKKIFDIEEGDLAEARGASLAYLALKKYVTENKVQAYAPDCWPECRDIDHTPLCPANGRLNQEGIMASCEVDVDGALSLMVQYAMTNGGAPWLADYVNNIEAHDALLWLHCGNAPDSFSARKPKLERVFGGLCPTASMRAGVVTVCRINSVKGRFSIHAGVGDVVESEPLLKGSTGLVRMRGGNMKFTRSMLENGIPHHNALVYGDISEGLREFGKLLNIPVVIC